MPKLTLPSKVVPRKLTLPSKRVLQLPLRYPDPPPDEHVPMLRTKSSGLANEIKQLVYLQCPEVRSVRVDCEYPDGTIGAWYTIIYVVMVIPPEDVTLRQVFLRTIQRYPDRFKERLRGYADRSLGFRPKLLRSTDHA